MCHFLVLHCTFMALSQSNCFSGHQLALIIWLIACVSCIFLSHSYYFLANQIYQFWYSIAAFCRRIFCIWRSDNNIRNCKRRKYLTETLAFFCLNNSPTSTLNFVDGYFFVGHVILINFKINPECLVSLKNSKIVFWT